MALYLEDDTIRYVLRKRRIKELKKSMGDLSDDHLISKASISNLEKAKGNIRPRVMEEYLKKLRMTEDEVVEQAQKVREELEEYYDHLTAIEYIIDRGDPATALEQLEQFQLEEYHPSIPYILFLQGRICYEAKDYRRAREKFLHAIDLCTKKYTHNPFDNIIAACYRELAGCSYNENHLEQALTYVELGLQHYDETKERKGLKYHLLGNKVMYLLKSSQYEQASRLLDRIWVEVEGVDNRFGDAPLFNLYKYRAITLRDSNMYEDAYQCCKQGLQIARNRSDGRISHYLDFLIISGSIHLKQQEWKKAFNRFQLALDSDKGIRSPRRHVDAHTYLGILFNSKKDWEQSLYHLDKAIQIEQENPDPFRLSKALIVKGHFHWFQNQFPTALTYYQEAVHLSRRYGYKQREYTALLKSANCFDKMGDKLQKCDCLEEMHRLQNELFIISEVEIYEA